MTAFAELEITLAGDECLLRAHRLNANSGSLDETIKQQHSRIEFTAVGDDRGFKK